MRGFVLGRVQAALDDGVALLREEHRLEREGHGGDSTTLAVVRLRLAISKLRHQVWAVVLSWLER